MKKKKHIKRPEWSKVVCALIIAYGMITGIVYYIAVFMNKSVDSGLAIQCVITIIGAYVSYVLYQGALKTSLNKNKLTVDKLTGVVRDLSNNDFLGATEKTSDDPNFTYADIKSEYEGGKL